MVVNYFFYISLQLYKFDFPDLALMVAEVPVPREQDVDVWHLDVGGTALAHLGRVVPLVAGGGGGHLVCFTLFALMRGRR